MAEWHTKLGRPLIGATVTAELGREACYIYIDTEADACRQSDVTCASSRSCPVRQHFFVEQFLVSVLNALFDVPNTCAVPLLTRSARADQGFFHGTVVCPRGGE